MGLIVGIDVAKESIEVALENGSELGAFPRTKTGLKRLVRELKDVEVDRVVVEATGGWERLVCSRLFEADLDVVMVQPGRARSFAKACGKHAKTDAIDAGLLARMGPVVRDLPNWKPMPEIVEQLRGLSDTRDTLLKHRDDLKKTVKSPSAMAGNKHLKAIIRHFDTQISEVEKDIEKLVKSSDLKGPISVLETTKGVGIVTAVVMVVRMPELGTLTRAKVAALAGLAPMNDDSADRKGHRKTKGGRSRVRRALYMAALSGARTNAVLKPYYIGLLARGKHKKVAQVAVMRKLLLHLNSLMRAYYEEQTATAQPC